ncbi:transposase [Bacteroidia bacterium]|nr:transposase [Bacteroidia bacterium]
MASIKFKPVVRTNKEFNAVYIRITTTDRADYIKTSMIAHRDCVEHGEIIDWNIIGNCATIIKGYIEKLNNVNTDHWRASDVKKFLTEDSEEISFTGFAKKYIMKMQLAGRIKPARNYQTALNSLLNFTGKQELNFSDITSKKIRDWIEFLSDTNRAKNMYPHCICKIFDEGCKEYNDYDRNILRISNQPFRVIEIPSTESPEKRTTDADTIRKIMNISPVAGREELAHDVMLLVICLAGINTVDLYNMNSECRNGDYMKYNRTKTETKRKDKAYFQIQIHKEIKPLFEKYKGSDRLFCFSDMYSDADIFSQNVNKGIKSLCEKAEVPRITVYWLRHTWATIARNHCGASIEDVAFCLNHSSAHRVTEQYIDKNFDLVDRVNEKVLKHIFI